MLAAEGDQLLLLACRSAQRQPTGVAHSQVTSLTWREPSAAERIAGDGAALGPFAAALHAAMMAGAMTRVLEMSLQYCNDRSQYGRSLGKFQALLEQARRRGLARQRPLDGGVGSQRLMPISETL